LQTLTSESVREGIKAHKKTDLFSCIFSARLLSKTICYRGSARQQLSKVRTRCQKHAELFYDSCWWLPSL